MGAEVHVEVLTRLNLANVTVISKDLLHKVNTVVAQGPTIRVNNFEIHCEELIFKHTSVEIRREDNEEGIWFRLPLDSGGLLTDGNEQVDLVINREHILNNFLPSSGMRMKKPDVEVATDVQIFCQTCLALIARLRPERVLPLPSSGWRLTSADWFCCSTRHSASAAGTKHSSTADSKHSSSAADKIGPRSQDFLYDSAKFVLNRSDVVADCLLLVDQGSGEVSLTRCSSCSSELGEMDGDHVYFWYYATRLKTATCLLDDKTRNGDQSNLESPENPVARIPGENPGTNASRLIVPGIQTAEDNFIHLVTSRILQSPTRMPSFKFYARRDNQSRSIRVWTLDKCLTSFRSRILSEGAKFNIERRTVIKLAFSLEQCDQNKCDTRSSTCDKSSASGGQSYLDRLALEGEVRVSEAMLETGLEYLQGCCEHFPLPCKFVTDKQIAFLPRS